jgi:CHAT domain-containing protein
MILEIFKQGEGLAMSISEYGRPASTIKQYSQPHVRLPEANKLCLEATALLNKINMDGGSGTDSIDDLKKSGQLLWDTLLTRPVKDTLKHAGARDLILLLDEELISVPWELMHDGKEFLCLSFNLGRLVRSKEPLHPVRYRSVESRLRMLVLADPTNDLKSAYSEGLFIKNRFGGETDEVTIDFKSTSIDTLYVKKYLRDYDIVHFAGHCEYEAVQRRGSGWVLSDGRFTAQDIMSLGESLSLPALVFSNSCHSANPGEASLEADYQEKTYSLASAFLFAGVRHYIGAIFKIEDQASALFAREFYLRLMRGKALGESLRSARLELIRQFGASRLAWASYLLYGDPHCTLFQSKEKPREKKIQHSVFLSRRSLVKAGTGACLAAACALAYVSFIRYQKPLPAQPGKNDRGCITIDI